MGGWPFVGRAEVLDRLLGLTVGGEQRGAVLVGRAGMGKTALAERCAESALHAGMTVQRVRATRAARGLPFGAFAPLLPADGEVRGSDDLAALLELYASRLPLLAREGRMMLVVDDAHCLDDASAVLVHELASRGDETILVTVKTEEPAPEPIVALWKEDILERIDVRGLDVGSIQQLLGAVLDGPVDPMVGELLDGRSQGNPMFVRELVIAALDEGALRKEAGVWRLTRWPAVSDRLVDLVKANLAKLTSAEEHLLELVAFTEPLGSLELDTLELHDAAESLEQRGLVSSRLAGRRLELWLAHPLFGDAMRAQLGVLRQRRMATARANVLETTGLRRREDALVVASWRLLSGGGSPELLLAGALSARSRHDHLLTERLATAAVNAGAGFRAKFLRAQMPSLRGRGDVAEERLSELATQCTSDAERVEVAGARIDAALRSGRPALPILEDAEATIRESSWRDRLAAARCAVMMVTEGFRASFAVADPIIRGSEAIPAQLYVLAIHCLVRLGRLSEACALLARARAEPDAGSMYGAWDAELLHRSIDALSWSGRLHEAESVAVRALRTAMVDHDFMAQAYGSTALAQCQLEQGRPRAAAATAREAFRVFHMHGRLLPAHEAGWTAAISLALVGDVAEAGKVLDDTDALGGELASGAPRRHEVEAWIAAAAGDLRGARRLLAEAAEELTRVGDLQHAAAALHGIVRLGYANVAADRLTALALEMDGDFVRTRALHATALAAHDTRRLEHVAEVFATMGANLYAAEAHAAAAVDHRRDGRAREGASAARRAAAFAARCEGAITPALLGVEGRVRLTPAELETANLAAAGHSNREIAEMLVVSLRTVENRLYRIYEKLGVSGRDDLARALRES